MPKEDITKISLFSTTSGLTSITQLVDYTRNESFSFYNSTSEPIPIIFLPPIINELEETGDDSLK